jgi:hypothetical protein
MHKTWEDYYNNSEIVNEPSAMREIHAIRLMIHDERQGLSWTEYNDMVNKRAEAFLAHRPTPNELQ